MMKRILNNLYPFIFGLFPVLSLYLHNYYQVEFFRVVRSLLAALVLTGLVLLIFRAAFRRGNPARVAATLVLVVLLNYGVFYEFLAAHPLDGINLGRARYLAPALIVLLTAAILAIAKKKKLAAAADRFGNWFGAALAIVLLFNAGGLLLQSAKQQAERQNAAASTTATAEAGTGQEMPDIYHIILDGYTSSRALQEDFGYDNSGFEGELKALGFEIPAVSMSNYDETVASLGSELNMELVQFLVPTEEADPNKLRMVDKLVNSQVRTDLEAMGYKTFAFENEFRWALWGNADFYLSPRNRNLLTGSINSFEEMLLKNTAVRIATNYDKLFLNRWFEDLGHVNLDKYEEQSYILQELPNLPEHITPKFVFAHTTITHVPFVFDSDGSPMPVEYQGSNDNTDFTDPQIREGYLRSIEYANRSILADVKAILEKNPDAIIILQGDHGYPGENRHQILLAVHDTKHSIAGQDCMTPINLYRLIFNNWFGTDAPLLSNTLFKTLSTEYYQYEPLGTCESVAGN